MNKDYKPGLKRDVDKKLVSELDDLGKINFTIAGYDRVASEWDKTRQNLWPELLSEIEKYIKSNTKVLDLGCGNGRLIKDLEKYDLDYTGLDPSEELIKIAKIKYPSKKLETFDGLTFKNINLGDETFDQVISIAVLHHIPPTLIHAWLSEAYRVTKSNTISIFTTWNLSESKYDLNDKGDAVIGFIHTPNTRYVHYYNYYELRNIFEKVGYEILEIKDIKRESGMSNTVIIVRK